MTELGRLLELDPATLRGCSSGSRRPAWCGGTATPPTSQPQAPGSSARRRPRSPRAAGRCREPRRRPAAGRPGAGSSRSPRLHDRQVGTGVAQRRDRAHVHPLAWRSTSTERACSSSVVAGDDRRADRRGRRRWRARPRRGGPSRCRAASTSTASAPALSQIRNDAVPRCSPRGPGERSGSPETNMPTACSAVVVPVVAGHLAAARGAARPGPWGRRSIVGPPLEPVPLPQRRVLAPQPQRGLGDLVDVEPRVVGPPVDPRDLVVLARRRCCCRPGCGRARRRR